MCAPHRCSTGGGTPARRTPGITRRESTSTQSCGDLIRLCWSRQTPQGRRSAAYGDAPPPFSFARAVGQRTGAAVMSMPRRCTASDRSRCAVAAAGATSRAAPLTRGGSRRRRWSHGSSSTSGLGLAAISCVRARRRQRRRRRGSAPTSRTPQSHAPAHASSFDRYRSGRGGDPAASRSATSRSRRPSAPKLRSRTPLLHCMTK